VRTSEPSEFNELNPCIPHGCSFPSGNFQKGTEPSGFIYKGLGSALRGHLHSSIAEQTLDPVSVLDDPGTYSLPFWREGMMGGHQWRKMMTFTERLPHNGRHQREHPCERRLPNQDDDRALQRGLISHHAPCSLHPRPSVKGKLQQMTELNE
jgi:hypothetical protein